MLIVGGSVVGLSTALFLATAGTTPLLVERHAGTAVHLRVANLTARTMEIVRSVEADTALRQIDPRSRTASVVPLVESLVGAEVENPMEDMRSHQAWQPPPWWPKTATMGTAIRRAYPFIVVDEHAAGASGLRQRYRSSRRAAPSRLSCG